MHWTADDHDESHMYGPATAWRAAVPVLPALLGGVGTDFAVSRFFCTGGANPKRAI